MGAPEEIVVSPVTEQDLGELLTLQRAAFVTEAQVVGNISIPPLTETISEIRHELRSGVLIIKVTVGHRIVGSGRGKTRGKAFEISRMAVAPDMQSRGIGRRILTELESLAPEGTEKLTLYTGAASLRNRSLYERAGYEFDRIEEASFGNALVHMVKAVR